MSLGVRCRHGAARAILARSLASGHGYRYLNLPGAPVATQHPPGMSPVLQPGVDFPGGVAYRVTSPTAMTR